MLRRIKQEFVSANILAVTIEHNGYKGGDSGHGGYVRITFENRSCTDMYINGNECENFEILFRGDTERDTFLDAFKLIVKELKENP